MPRALPPLAGHEEPLPLVAYITPSNINPWRGARAEGDFFTYAQVRAMPSYQLDPETCDFLIVRSPASMREMWWPLSTPNPVFVFPCPIVSRRGDGTQLLVISPAGIKKWVYADGSITRARAEPSLGGRPRATRRWRP